MLGSGHKEKERIAADHERDGHALAAAKIFLTVHVAMFPRNNEQTHRLAIVDHRTVATDVDPALVRIHSDRVTARADVAAAIVDVPDRRGKFGHIDVISSQNVFKYRTVTDDYWWDVLRVGLIMIKIRLAELLLGQMTGKSQGHIASLAGKDIDEHAKSLGTSRHLVEDDCRSIVRRDHNVGGKPDLFLP